MFSLKNRDFICRKSCYCNKFELLSVIVGLSNSISSFTMFFLSVCQDLPLSGLPSQRRRVAYLDFGLPRATFTIAWANEELADMMVAALEKGEGGKLVATVPQKQEILGVYEKALFLLIVRRDPKLEIEKYVR